MIYIWLDVFIMLFDNPSLNHSHFLSVCLSLIHTKKYTWINKCLKQFSTKFCLNYFLGWTHNNFAFIALISHSSIDLWTNKQTYENEKLKKKHISDETIFSSFLAQLYLTLLLIKPLRNSETTEDGKKWKDQFFLSLVRLWHQVINN